MKIKLNKNEKILCAKFRPGHFEGVLAVIKQFLINIKPKYMFLGEKDYQQIILIKKFIKNKFKTKVIICKTVRFKNLLAYSSRNILLNKNDLKKALLVSGYISKFYSSLKNNFNNNIKLNKIKNELKNKKIKFDYLELRNKKNLSKKFNKNNFKIFIAYYVGNVRLIDNF